MAIPPPHIFINVKSAKLLDAKTLELKFDHPRCDDPKVLGTHLYWARYDEKKAPVHYREYSVALQELREDEGVATCKGPLTEQTFKVDLAKLIPDEGVTQGRLHFNFEPLYGYMKKLDEFAIAFDLNKP